MSYDAFKTESRDDYESRMHVHDRGELPESIGGICACGAETLRSVGGIGFQCHDCGRESMRQLFDRQARKIG